MQGSETIFINKNECTKCWRCIRECPVKAIDCGTHGARITGDRCIGCGQCLAMCRYGAIKLRNDILTARAIIKRHTVKAASVSPQWITEMDGLGEAKFVEALKLLGFTHISESALGAERTLSKEFSHANGNSKEIVSSRCPAVVRYFEKYAPRQKEMLSCLISPMEAHARMIKNWWGNDTAVIHFTACAAAKLDSENEDSSIDAVVTFGELKKWLREEGVESANLFGNGDFRFEPFAAKSGNLYPICGDIGSGAEYSCDIFSASPIQSTKRILRYYQSADKPLWLDFMACEKGCIGSGASSSEGLSAILQSMALREHAAARQKVDEYYNLPHIALEKVETSAESRNDFVAESDTMHALDELGIHTRAQQTDCNACGFGTCRRFAKALSRGEVDKDICWHYLKYGVTTKLDTLVAKLSAGVAIINSSMQIEQANRIFATTVGAEAEAIFDSREGIAGRDASQVVPFSNLITSVLESGEESLVRDVQIGEKLITVSVHTIQKHRLVLVICRNMLFSQVRNEEIVKRTQRVIDENLATVRNIAFLLGENASRTEAILNSILEANIKDNE